MSSAKLRPFCLSLNVLMDFTILPVYVHTYFTYLYDFTYRYFKVYAFMLQICCFIVLFILTLYVLNVAEGI